MNESSFKNLAIIICIIFLVFFIAIIIFVAAQIPGEALSSIITALVLAVLLIPLDIIYGAGKGSTYIPISYVIRDFFKDIIKKNEKD